MSGRDTITGLKESKDIDLETFEGRVREEGERLKTYLDSETFDNRQITIGLEYEFYAVETASGTLRRVPRSLLETLGFERELGLHNAELTSSVYPCNHAGLTALRWETEAKIRNLQNLAAEDGISFVSDGMWTIGPANGTTESYLMEATHEEGLSLAINISNAVRYHGFGSVTEHTPVGGRIDLPGATIRSETAGPVSLTSSIQPHVQPRRADDLPAYHNNALRVAGPLLALAVNSPFFPPGLYDDGELTDELLLEGSHAENRIPVYEGMMNPSEGSPKVTFPRDLDSPQEAVDRIVADKTIVPAVIEEGPRFDDQFVHVRHKHGSFWRWVRPVFDGASEVDANARIEFRPLPGQPTLPDTIALVAAVAGSVIGLSESEHPVSSLRWDVARENFYAAAREGVSAEMQWITADGERVSEIDRLYDDLFSIAVAGLEKQGFDTAEATDWIAPLRDRVTTQTSPAGWKRRIVAGELESGSTPGEAIHEAQRRYLRHQAHTFYDGSLSEWPSE
ncbi:hypothetical protein [Halorubrum vacuolatum]|nr:hypothetical protein [Halorubrum vacuolatum]